MSSPHYTAETNPFEYAKEMRRAKWVSDVQGTITIVALAAMAAGIAFVLCMIL